MRLVSFDPFRTLGLSGVRYIKPEHMHRHLDDLKAADWLLFPEYWQLNTLHYVLKKRIFPSLCSYHLGHDKIEMTRAFQAACPNHLPDTDILASTPANVRDVLARWPLPFVAKKPRASMGLGVFLIETPQQLHDYAASSDVLYVQKLLPIERDLRVVLVGNQVVSAYWREGSGFLNNVARGGIVRNDLPIPDNAIDFVRSLSGFLDINHAGFDIAMVDGKPMVLEFNRLFGNQGAPGLQQKISRAMSDYLFASAPPPSPLASNLSA